MFEWKVEDMALLNEESNIFIGKERIYKCEQEVSREDKIAFVDSLQDGKLSYILSLVEKFNKDKDNLPKDRYGYVKTVSLKAWLKRNDTEKMVDSWYRYGNYSVVGVSRSIEFPNSKRSFDTYDDFVDEVFHCQLKKCEEKEYKYFLEHDEYSILKRKLENKMDKYHTTFGVDIITSSSGSIYIYKENDDGYCNEKRDITIDELKYLISKYEELDKLVDKITKEINIVY